MTMLPQGSGTLALPPAQNDPLFGPQDAGGQINVVALVHRLLRGRYLLTAGLAAAVGLTGAVAGYFATQPKYEARGVIAVQAVLPRLLYQTEKSEFMPLFNSFVNRQAFNITETRTIRLALNSEEWKRIGRGATDADVDEFRDSVAVILGPNSQELISVTYRDTNRTVALTAVQSLIRAYSTLYANTQGTMDQDITLLERRRNDLERNVERTQNEIRAFIHTNGTDQIESLQQAALTQVQDVERAIRAIDLILPPAEADAANPAAPAAPDQTPATPRLLDPDNPPPVEELAALSTDIQNARDLVRRIEDALAEQKTLGLLDGHPVIRRLSGQLQAAQASLDKTVRTYLEANKGRPMAAASGPGSAQAALAETPEQLRTRRDSLLRQLAAARAELTRFTELRLEIGKLRERLTEDSRLAAETANALNSLRVEAQALRERALARIQVLNEGDARNVPTVDRRLPFAAAGFLGGGGLVVAAMLAIGLLDRRYRFVEDAASHGPGLQVLGILPELPADESEEKADPEQAAAAAHSVHQIRLMLALGRHHKESSQVYAITSPSSGDGKTSLTLTLGMSFANAGYRTVLVDMDMIGGGLSTNLGFGKADGILHALDAGNLNGTVVPAGIPNLSLLPTRKDDAQHVGRLAGPQVSRLIRQLREQYEVVIIDTGPVLGSLEASLAAKEADSVILVIGRGQQRDNTRKAQEHLTNIGARLAGLVFNRAQAGDFKRSVSGMSFRSVPMPQAGAEPQPAPARDAARVGPLAAIISRQAAGGHESPPPHAGA